MNDVTPDDRDLAIRTMLGEEGSEEGWAGVAAVILNRLAAGSYGGSVGDVVLAPHQFEAWTRQSDRLLGIRRHDPRYVAAGQLFDAVRDGSLPDPTNGATHFYAPAAQAALGRQAPGWSQGQGLRLGSSMFYAPQGRVRYKPDAPQTYLDFAEGLKRLDAQPQSEAKNQIAASQIAKSLPQIAASQIAASQIAKSLPQIAASQIAKSLPQIAASQVPNRPPAFLKDAQPVAPPQAPNRPPAFLKDAVAVPKPDVGPAPGFVEKGVSELGRISTEAPKAIGEMFREGVTAELGAGRENVARGVAAMRSGPAGWLGGATSDIIGTLQEASSPFAGAANALLGVGGWTDPAMVGMEAPHIAPVGGAAKYARTAGVDSRGVAGELAPTLTQPIATESIPIPPPPAPQHPPAFLPDDAKPVSAPTAKPTVAPVVKPVESPSVKPAAPVESPPVKPVAVPEIIGPRITQPKAQALVDDLRKRFGVEKPIPVSVSNAGDPNAFGALRTNWGDAKEALLDRFRRTGTVDPTMGTPNTYAIAIRSDSSDRALSVRTLLHEFGHVLQNEKYVTAPPETRAAILAAFHRETQAFGKLSPEDFPAAALDPVHTATVQDLEARVNGTVNASSHQEYNQRFNEWFANQVATWFTSTREATSVVDKFFKGIADAWKAIYQRVAGRQGAAPEIDAFMRGMWDENKAVEEAPRPAPRAERPATLPSDIPTTVYRGSGRADPTSVYNQGMGPQSVPIAGSGRYYAFNKSDAQTFGPSVASAEMPVQNPLVIRDGNAWWELTRKAGWEFPNPSGTPEAQMREMTQRLQEVVRGMGHDGIIAYWDDSSPHDVGPKGENLKLLRSTFGMPQVVAFEKKASRISMKGERSMLHGSGRPSGPLEELGGRLPF